MEFNRERDFDFHFRERHGVDVRGFGGGHPGIGGEPGAGAAGSDCNLFNRRERRERRGGKDMIRLPEPISLPAELVQQLERRRGKYTVMKAILHAVWFDQDCIAGVAGDGDNASYEWFIHTPDGFESSDCGYGDSVCALLAVLQKVAS
jgi:hypothetical protein